VNRDGQEVGFAKGVQEWLADEGTVFAASDWYHQALVKT